jgi:hypothetical protein
MSKNKCPACKFDNCRAEFMSHPSNTSFSSLELQLQRISSGLKEDKIEEWVKTLCPTHVALGSGWLDGVWAYYDKLKEGVLLPKFSNKTFGTKR